MVHEENMAAYFSGEKLYGDDFSEEQIAEWYRDEAEGYADLGAKHADSYRYSYHALNWIYGYRHLKGRKFKNALGLGSAYGDEFIPISSQISSISIVDASESFKVSQVKNTPVTYFKAQQTGDLPFADGVFDLATCFGVLHHVPNVSHVLRELHRCIAPNGILLLREPTASMGDWRKPRPGLTKRERGIPFDVLGEIIHKAGFEIERVSHCFFPLTSRFWKPLRITPYNSMSITYIDRLLSLVFKWNYSYHRQSIASKFAPAGAFWFLRR